jgi:hypothetical protein
VASSKEVAVPVRGLVAGLGHPTMPPNRHHQQPTNSEHQKRTEGARFRGCRC